LLFPRVLSCEQHPTVSDVGFYYEVSIGTRVGAAIGLGWAAADAALKLVLRGMGSSTSLLQRGMFAINETGYNSLFAGGMFLEWFSLSISWCLSVFWARFRRGVLVLDLELRFVSTSWVFSSLVTFASAQDPLSMQGPMWGRPACRPWRPLTFVGLRSGLPAGSE
jgi:hypothetical protein